MHGACGWLGVFPRIQPWRDPHAALQPPSSTANPNVTFATGGSGFGRESPQGNPRLRHSHGMRKVSGFHSLAHGRPRVSPPGCTTVPRTGRSTIPVTVFVVAALLVVGCGRSSLDWPGQNPESSSSPGGAGGTVLPGQGTGGTGTVTSRPEQVAVGSTFSCLLRSDGSTTCWGCGSNIPTSEPVNQIAASWGTTCVLKQDGSAQCWGGGNYLIDPPTGPFVQISAGIFYACALRADGTVACWGMNSSGQIWSPPDRFTQISAGAEHACGVRTDGTVACWGSNLSGQTTPPSGTFTQVSANFNDSCGVRTDGTLACWGLPDVTSPPKGTFTQVAVGLYFACALRSNGTVACWGDNSIGQTNAPSGTFVQLSAVYSACAVRSNGSVACWGCGSNDSCGNCSPKP